MSSHTHDVYASYSRYVTANNVVVRKKASNKGKIVGSYKKAAKVRCYKKKRSYTKIKYGRYYRYIATRYLSKKKPVVVTAQKAANITTDTYTRYVTSSSLTIRKNCLLYTSIVQSLPQKKLKCCALYVKDLNIVKLLNACTYPTVSYTHLDVYKRQG